MADGKKDEAQRVVPGHRRFHAEDVESARGPDAGIRRAGGPGRRCRASGPRSPAPAGGMPFPNPAAMFATLDPAELERKIGELRIVEGWLQMSLNLMQLSIKTMELQKASLEALRGARRRRGRASAPAGRKS